MDPSRPPRPERGPSVARETAADVADTVRAYAQPVVDDALSRLAMMVLLVLLVPVGIGVLIVSFLLMGGLYIALGSPTGPAGTAFGIASLLATLAALFFVFRALYRRMPRRLRDVYASPPADATEALTRLSLTRATGGEVERQAPDVGPGASPSLSLAELDARLAPKETLPDQIG